MILDHLSTVTGPVILVASFLSFGKVSRSYRATVSGRRTFHNLCPGALPMKAFPTMCIFSYTKMACTSGSRP